MPDVTQIHAEKETIVVQVNLPGHAERVTTPLFERSRKSLIFTEKNCSFVTGCSEAEVGTPHEAHHFWIERCLADAVDWREFCEYIARFKAFVLRTAAFCDANPDLADIYEFVDDMTVNGMLIEKRLHTGAGLGIHAMPFPLWQFHFYGKEGFQFSTGDAIYHEDEAQPIVTPDTVVQAP